MSLQLCCTEQQHLEALQRGFRGLCKILQPPIRNIVYHTCISTKYERLFISVLLYIHTAQMTTTICFLPHSFDIKSTITTLYTMCSLCCSTVQSRYVDVTNPFMVVFVVHCEPFAMCCCSFLCLSMPLMLGEKNFSFLCLGMPLTLGEKGLRLNL